MSNQKNPKSYQNRLFWLPTFISIITLIIVLYSPSSKQNNQELKKYLKAYIDSTNTATQIDIDKTAIEVLDVIYGDTTITKKSKSD